MPTCFDFSARFVEKTACRKKQCESADFTSKVYNNRLWREFSLENKSHHRARRGTKVIFSFCFWKQSWVIDETVLDKKCKCFGAVDFYFATFYVNHYLFSKPLLSSNLDRGNLLNEFFFSRLSSSVNETLDPLKVEKKIIPFAINEYNAHIQIKWKRFRGFMSVHR